MPAVLNKKDQGISLYLSLVVMAILLTIVLGISVILIKQMRIISNMDKSVVALSAADAGVERVLREVNNPSAGGLLSSYLGNLGNGSDYNINITACDGSNPGGVACNLSLCTPPAITLDPNCPSSHYCIRSLGNYRGSKRAIEVYYGGGEESSDFESHDNTTPDLTYFFTNGEDHHLLAQTFFNTNANTIKKLFLPIYKNQDPVDAGFTFIIQIYPTELIGVFPDIIVPDLNAGALYATNDILANNLPDFNDYSAGDYGQSITEIAPFISQLPPVTSCDLQAGVKYAIVLRITNTSPDPADEIIWGFYGGAGYPDGDIMEGNDCAAAPVCPAPHRCIFQPATSYCWDIYGGGDSSFVERGCGL